MHSETHHGRLFLFALLVALLALALLPRPVHSRWLAQRHTAPAAPAALADLPEPGTSD